MSYFLHCNILHKCNILKLLLLCCYFYGRCSVELNCIIQPVQTITARTCHPTSMDLNHLPFLHVPLRQLSPKNIVELTPTLLPSTFQLLTSSSQGSIVNSPPPYPHNVHFPPSPFPFISHASFIFTILL